MASKGVSGKGKGAVSTDSGVLKGRIVSPRGPKFHKRMDEDIKWFVQEVMNREPGYRKGRSTGKTSANVLGSSYQASCSTSKTFEEFDPFEKMRVDQSE